MASGKRVATVAVVSGRRLVADALRAALDAQRGIRAVGSATSPAEAEALVRTETPDVILLDPEISGVDAPAFVRDVRGASGDSTVIVLTERQSDLELASVVEAGAAGHVPVDASIADVADVVRRGAAKERLIGPAEGRRLLGLLRHRRVQRASARERADRLTRRELEVLQLLAEGRTARELASVLGVSPYTARTHVQNVLTKLGVSSKTEAVSLAIRHGKVSIGR